jgi:hypothetical protein
MDLQGFHPCESWIHRAFTLANPCKSMARVLTQNSNIYYFEKFLNGEPLGFRMRDLRQIEERIEKHLWALGEVTGSSVGGVVVDFIITPAKDFPVPATTGTYCASLSLREGGSPPSRGRDLC